MSPFIILRISLALVFIGLGIDRFLHPNYWLTVASPNWLEFIGGRLSLVGLQLVYAVAVFEILIGLGILFGIFTKFFSGLAVLFLTGMLLSNGLDEIGFRDLGLIGVLIAIIFWPNKRSKF